MERVLALALLLSAAAFAQKAPDAPAEKKVEYKKVIVFDFDDDVMDVCSLPRCPYDEDCFPRRKPYRLVRVPEDFRSRALDDFPAR